MNSNGIMPTVDLATNGGYNNSFFGGEGIWAIVLIALLFSGNEDMNMVEKDMVIMKTQKEVLNIC